MEKPPVSKKKLMATLCFRSNKDFGRCMRIVGPLIGDFSLFGMGKREISLPKDEFGPVKALLGAENLRYTVSEEEF